MCDLRGHEKLKVSRLELGVTREQEPHFALYNIK